MTDKSYTPIRNVMTASPIAVDGLATVKQAVELMHQHNVNSLVVDKRDDSDEYGIVAVHDIAEQIISRGRAPERVSVYEIMSKPVLSFDVDMNIKYAVRLLVRFRLSRALVLDQGKFVGIVTLRDLVFRSIAPAGVGAA